MDGCWATKHETWGLHTQDEKAEWLIYVTDEGQAGHFKLVFGAGRRWGIIPEENPPRIDHVGFGLVLGSDGKRIRTRDMGAVRAPRLPAPAQHQSLHAGCNAMMAGILSNHAGMLPLCTVWMCMLTKASISV